MVHVIREQIGTTSHGWVMMEHMGAEGDDRLVVTDRVRIPRHELSATFTPSGGPGGQHANKTATRVELTFDVAASSAFDETQRARVIGTLGNVVRVVADDERSQTRNRALADERLAAKIRTALHVPRRRRPTRPTRGAQRRRLDAKSRRSDVKSQRRKPTVDD